MWKEDTYDKGEYERERGKEDTKEKRGYGGERRI
jgi:hypothetical protein